MDYSLITEEQIQKRFDTLPDNIIGVLESDNNLEILRRICRQHFLTDKEKILIVEQLIALVILGFVSIDEFASEITENIHINKKHSDDIAGDIDKEFFAPILADIKRIYNPIMAESEKTYKEKSPIIIDVAKSEFKAKDDEAGIKEIEIEPEMKLEKNQKKEELETYFAELKGEKPVESKPATFDLQADEEFGIDKKEFKIEEAKPVIIQKEAEIKPASKLKVSLGGLMGIFKGAGDKKKSGDVAVAEIQFGKSTKEENPPVSGIPSASWRNERENNHPDPLLERGQETPFEKGGKGDLEGSIVNSQKSKVNEAPMRVVHYSDLRTPLSDLQLTVDQQPTTNDQRQRGNEEKNDFVPKIINLMELARNNAEMKQTRNNAEKDIRKDAEEETRKDAENDQQQTTTPPAGGQQQDKEKTANLLPLTVDEKKEEKSSNPLLERGQETPFEKGGKGDLEQISINNEPKKKFSLFGLFGKKIVIANNANNEVITQIKEKNPSASSHSLYERENSSFIKGGARRVEDFKSLNQISPKESELLTEQANVNGIGNTRADKKKISYLDIHKKFFWFNKSTERESVDSRPTTDDRQQREEKIDNINLQLTTNNQQQEKIEKKEIVDFAGYSERNDNEVKNLDGVIANNANKEVITKINDASKTDEMLRKAQHDEQANIKIDGEQPQHQNIDDIQLKDIPLDEDTIDLRNL